MQPVSYVIITPARDEQEHIQEAIRSVAAQTIKPAKWIVVDDGSTDATGQIIEEAAKRHDWIHPIHRKDRGSRLAGAGVMQAFYAGLRGLGDQSWQYLVKLDGDVTFAPEYFERCFARFAAEPCLGIAGGLVCNPVNGALVAEADDPPFHVRGATKIYKRECWQAIRGLVEAAGWDTVDEFKANMLGWTTRTFSDIKLIHHRHAGAAYGTWSNWLKNGYANYVAGYHPVFMLLKCAKRSFKKPYGVGALGLALGFCGGYVRGLPQVQDAELIRYVREEQMKRLLFKRSLWG